MKAHVLSAGDTFGTGKISLGAVATLLSFTGVVDEKLGHFTQGATFFAIVDDETGTAGLRGLNALLKTMDEIGSARANVRAEHVRAIALVMDANRQRPIRVGNRFYRAHNIHGETTDWR